MPDSHARSSGRASSIASWRWGVMALAVFVVFFQLGTRGLNEPDEGRYAEIGREMAATGDFLTPRFNGVTHLAKPPLTYWLIALSIRAFGVNEWAARLPSALGALGTLLAVYLLARSACGERAGLWAVVVLLSSALFFGMARLITTDMLLTCFVTWSVWSLWRWYASADRSWKKILWFYVFLGFGMITKGPVAVMLPLFALAGLRWRNPTLRLRQMGWGKGALIFLAIAAPWFVAVAGTDWHRWRYFLGREVVGRVATTVHHRTEAMVVFSAGIGGGVFALDAVVVRRGRAAAGNRARERVGALVRRMAVAGDRHVFTQSVETGDLHDAVVAAVGDSCGGDPRMRWRRRTRQRCRPIVARGRGRGGLSVLGAVGALGDGGDGEISCARRICGCHAIARRSLAVWFRYGCGDGVGWRGLPWGWRGQHWRCCWSWWRRFRRLSRDCAARRRRNMWRIGYCAKIPLAGCRWCSADTFCVGCLSICSVLCSGIISPRRKQEACLNWTWSAPTRQTA